MLPADSRMASDVKFSLAINSIWECWRRVSCWIASNTCGSISASGLLILSCSVISLHEGVGMASVSGPPSCFSHRVARESSYVRDTILACGFSTRRELWGDRIERRSGRQDRRRSREPIQQNRYRAAAQTVDDSQVRLAVTVEIVNDDADRRGATGKRRFGL